MPQRKKRRGLPKQGPFPTAQKAMEGLSSQKNFSNRIDYGVLKSLFGESGNAAALGLQQMEDEDEYRDEKQDEKADEYGPRYDEDEREGEYEGYEDNEKDGECAGKLWWSKLREGIEADRQMIAIKSIPVHSRRHCNAESRLLVKPVGTFCV